MTADPTSGHQTLEFLVSDGKVRQVGPGHMGCKHSDCANAEFWITTDGRIICADDECFTEYGHLASVTPDEFAKLRNACRTMGKVITGMAESMEAARIEMIQNGPEAAMQWILNSLPDVSDEAPEDQWDGKETATQWIDRVQAADRAAEVGEAAP